MDNLRSVFCGLSTERYREDRAADIKKSRGAPGAGMASLHAGWAPPRDEFAPTRSVL